MGALPFGGLAVRFTVRHQTRYEYSAEVKLGPHVLRVQPRQDGSVHHCQVRLAVEPAPALQTHYVDVEGNAAIGLWFLGSTRFLAVDVQIDAETSRSNPYDFLLTDEALRLPLDYSSAHRVHLEPYLVRAPSSRAVDELVDTLRAASGTKTVAFLDRLNWYLCENVRRIVREDGVPWPPERTLRERRGACRDVATLFIDACRTVGVAARFVSGYQLGDPQCGPRFLHAWAEVYLPGGGWRGYDPTKGLMVSGEHLPVAAAAIPADASPIVGTFIGPAVESNMTADVALRAA